MKLFQLTTPILFLLFQVTIYAQALSPSVISTSGGFHENAPGSLSFTFGELAAVETLTSTTGILTQGFQQYWDIGTYVIEDPALPISFGIYPNISDGNFHMVTESAVSENVYVRIFDFNGQRNIPHFLFS